MVLGDEEAEQAGQETSDYPMVDPDEKLPWDDLEDEDDDKDPDGEDPFEHYDSE